MAKKKAVKLGKSKKKRKHLVVAKKVTRVKKRPRVKRTAAAVVEIARKVQDKLGAEAVHVGSERPVAKITSVTSGNFQERDADRCPYCESKDFVKRGLRENKHQQVQLYVCRNTECGRTFTSRTIKGKQFPWPVVLDAVSYHNLGYTFEQAAQILEAKRGVKPMPDTMAKWYEEYKPLCRFERMRPYALKILAAWRARNPGAQFDMVETTTLAHRQLYRFRYHRPKLVDVVGIQALRENIRTFFDLIDTCWGIKSVQYKESAIYMRGQFLFVLARLLSDHYDFWQDDAEKRLFQGIKNSHFAFCDAVGIEVLKRNNAPMLSQRNK